VAVSYQPDLVVVALNGGGLGQLTALSLRDPEADRVLLVPRGGPQVVSSGLSPH
jgi:hypothetical protein